MAQRQKQKKEVPVPEGKYRVNYADTLWKYGGMRGRVFTTITAFTGFVEERRPISRPRRALVSRRKSGVEKRGEKNRPPYPWESGETGDVGM